MSEIDYTAHVPRPGNRHVESERSAVNGHGIEPPDDGWTPPTEIPDDVAVETGKASHSASVSSPREPLCLKTLSDLDGVKPTPRRWLARSRIPMRAVTIMSGDGSAGKTTIAMQLIEATAYDGDWLGCVIDEPGPAVFVSAEEDEDELHRRFADIAHHTGRSFSDKIKFYSTVGKASELAVADRAGQIRPTDLYEQLLLAVSEIQPKLIVLEAAADVFGGDENSRPQVRAFSQLLRRLAITADAAVVLIQHPSVSGMAEGQGRSGSTAWRNSARSQLYFAGAKGEAGEDDVRELRVVKSNYGPAGEVVAVRWQAGVFVPVGGASEVEKAAADATVEALFLRLLALRNAQGRFVGAKPSKNYAPAVFADMAEADGVKASAFGAAMERLFATKKLELRASGIGPKSRQPIVLFPS